MSILNYNAIRWILTGVSDSYFHIEAMSYTVQDCKGLIKFLSWETFMKKSYIYLCIGLPIFNPENGSETGWIPASGAE